jgi:hypothetical protein
MSKCGIDKQITEHCDGPEDKECPTCFCILNEYLECNNCNYEADARADHITENQFNGKV